MIRIDDSPELSGLTTLRLGGRALAGITFSGAADLEALPRALEKLGGRPVALGGGSNVLAAGGERDRVLLRPALQEGPGAMGSDSQGHVLVRVDAAMALPRFLAWCARNGLSGLEGLAGVPGTVGGAVAGNAGSFGSSLGAALRRVRIFSPVKGEMRLEIPDFRCEYRHFSIPWLEDMAQETGKPAWYVITEVIVALRPWTKGDILDAMRAHAARKIETQPVRAWSAGCVFKNPDSSPREGTHPAAGTQVPAGKLLDDAGFRGKRRGGMFFSPMHANFLINDGTGKPEEALELIREAQETVRSRYGVVLRPEVRIWAS